MFVFSKITIFLLLFSLSFVACAAGEQKQAQEPDQDLADMVEPYAVHLPIVADLNLSTIVENTYRRNPSVAVYTARRKEAAALKVQARSFFAADPSIAISNNTDTIWSRDGFREWETGIQLPIWLPGQRGARRLVAESTDAVAQAAELMLRLAVAGSVREDLWNIALTANRLSLAELELATAKKLEKDVARRVELGDLARSDLILVAQETLEKQISVLRSEELRRHALHRYHIFTGSEVLPGDYRERPSVILTVTDTHPALALAEATLEQARAERGLSRRERRGNPTLTLGTRHERGQNGVDFIDSIGMSLQIPLGLRSQSAPSVARAASRFAVAQAARDKRLRVLKLALDQALHELHAVEQELLIAKQRHALAQEHLALARKAFTLGESDLFTLLRVQQSAFAAERVYSQNMIRLDLVVARYNQAVGVIP